MTDSAVVLGDNRRLAYVDHGDPNGAVVVCIHGTPGSHHQVLPDPSLVPEGIRAIAVDRPGYGRSNDHPGRSLVSFAQDIGAMTRHLGIEQFGLFGVSGGGPHALACAAVLADRVRATVLAGPVRPTSDPASSQGMMPNNRLITGLSRSAPLLLRPLLYATMGLLKVTGERGLVQVLEASPEADRELLLRPEFAQVFLTHFREPDRRTAAAVADDFALFARPWGFSFSDVGCPVTIYHGADDRNSPLEHGRWLAERCVAGRLVELPGEGHFGYLERLGELLSAATLA